MTTEIKSPTFPESVADGTIANWVKKEGDRVKQDEVIAEIETDKVVLEVVAPFDGVVSKVLKPAGETVLSAELIAEFTKEDIKSGKQGHAPRPNYDTYKPGSYHDFDVGGDKPPVYIGNNNEKKK